MSKSDHQAGPVSSGNAKTLAKWRREALALPEPGDTWVVANTELDGGDIQRMKEVGAVAPVGWDRVTVEREYDRGSGNYERRTWRTIPDVYNWIQDNLADMSECPAKGCRSTGISNPEGIDGYQCTSDDCDMILTEDEAKEILQ